jgi:two-component system, response regulator PdtaR
MAAREPEVGSSHGLVVLVVEDEFLIAMDLEAMLREHGWRVLGPAATVAKALSLLEDGEMPDVALLDVNLKGETVVPVAEVLRERGVPIVLASAYNHAASMADVLAGAPNIGKPAQERHLLATLKRAVEK